MKRINISTKKHPNTFALVDDCDFDRLNKHKWCCTNKGYVVRGRQRLNGGGLILMHRVILNTPEGMESDHKNGRKLDNQRANLRICTKKQNLQNQSLRKDSKSGYKGVCWNKADNKWRSQIRVNGKRKHLGLFTCLVKAAKAYDEAALKYHGKFAKLNFKGEVLC